MEYEQMIEAGLLRGGRVGLIHNVIVMSPQKAAHALVVQILTRLLLPPLVGRADVRVQLPLPAGDHSMPGPDLAVVAMARFGEPHPSSAFLVVEVAETSLREDRTEKAELYASVGVRSTGWSTSRIDPSRFTLSPREAGTPA